MADPEFDENALSAAHEDMRRLLDEELETHETLAQRGGSLFRYNVLLVGLLLSALSISGTDIILNLLSLTGIILLFAAAISGLITQYRVPVDAGPTKEIPDRIRQANPTESAYRRWSLQAYKKAIENTSQKSSWKEDFVEYGQINTLIGISLIMAGIYMETAML